MKTLLLHIIKSIAVASVVATAINDAVADPIKLVTILLAFLFISAIEYKEGINFAIKVANQAITDMIKKGAFVVNEKKLAKELNKYEKDN